MSLKVLIYPNSLLRTKALPIAREHLESESVVQAANDLRETLTNSLDGAALAATQCGLPIRMVAVGTALRKELPDILINPVVTWKSDEKAMEGEGCLSFPGISIPVERPERIVVEFMELDGEPRTVNLGPGFASRCIQHEVDHLEGKLFIDYLASRKRAAVHAIMLKHKLSGRR